MFLGLDVIAGGEVNLEPESLGVSPWVSPVLLCLPVPGPPPSLCGPISSSVRACLDFVVGVATCWNFVAGVFFCFVSFVPYLHSSERPVLPFFFLNSISFLFCGFLPFTLLTFFSLFLSRREFF
ncbi:hypothetical protein HOY80DRAFT_287595 [Tuber brumale]|nr:hypothetical protein HOY80DRAFT_287595 [Tuber brumale]